MTVLEIRIEGTPALAADLFGGGPVAPGRSVDLGDGIALEYRDAIPVRDVGESEILMLALSFPVSVLASVVGGRLLNHFQSGGHRTSVMTIERWRLRVGDWLEFESTFKKIVEAARSEGETTEGGGDQE